MIAGAILWVVLGVSPAGAAGGLGENPHGAPDRCAACHAPGASPSAAGAALPVVATCRSCHPTADMHPVGMAPRDIHVPASWPLEEGLVTCATCHAEPAHGGDAARLTAPWHRDGPYERITGLCYTCHEATEYTRSDPHHPGTARDPRDPTCAACHTGVPETGAPPDRSRLRLPSEEACQTCHVGDIHAGVAEHVRERADPVPTDPALPLMDGDRIACWTCHDVHQGPPAAPDRRGPAVAFHDRALGSDWAALAGSDLRWPGSWEVGHAPLLALPADDGALCRACHGDGP